MGTIIYYHCKLERLRLDIMVSAIEKVENPEVLAWLLQSQFCITDSKAVCFISVLHKYHNLLEELQYFNANLHTYMLLITLKSYVEYLSIDNFCGLI